MRFNHHSWNFELLSEKDVQAYENKKKGSGKIKMIGWGPVTRDNGKLESYENTTTTELFTAPSKPGDYDYVCTFPGHAMLMKGILRVTR